MSGDRGSITILVLGWIGVLVMVGVATASIGSLVIAREQAHTAAEAASLAAAVATYPPAARGAPGSLAVEYARRNGARVEGCRCLVDPALRPRTVTVITALEVDVPIFGEVTVRGAASSEFDPVRWLGG